MQSQSIESPKVVKKEDIKSESIMSATQNSLDARMKATRKNTALQSNNTSSTAFQKAQATTPKSAAVKTNTLTQPTIDQTGTQNKTTEITTSPIKTATTDTVKSAVSHTVVHVKAKPVIIEDTVVKVIRKARPKKE